MEAHEHLEDLPELPGLPTKADMLVWRAAIEARQGAGDFELVGVKETAEGLMGIFRRKGLPDQRR